ncbi:MAG: GGDEF domain-containing protein [Clostridia bacterium]
MTSQTLYALVYLEINLMAVVLIGIVLHRSWGLSRMVAQRNFAMTIYAEMLFFLSDTVAVMITSGVLPLGSAGLMAAKEIYFFSTTLMCFYWFVYFEHLQGSPFVQNRRSIRRSSVLVWVIGILLIINLFTGILFYVDAEGHYHRGKLFAVQYLLSYVYVFFTCFRAFLGLFDEKKRSQRRLLRALALFPLAPAVAGIVQFLFPQLPLACAALSIATLVMYMMWIDDMISVDPLTRLSNRKQLDYQYEQWQKGTDQAPAWLLMIDANKFKQINDTYGHIQGDAALVRIADALRNACSGLPRRANIARFGGDEFVVLVREDSPEQIAGLCGKIRAELKSLNEAAGSPYDLTVSIGMTKVRKGVALKDAIAEADRKLYEEKKA